MFDVFRMPFANRQIMKRLIETDTHPSFEPIRLLSDDDIKKYVESEWIRAKELDDKLFKLTASLSVALTVGGTVAKTIVDGLAPSTAKLVILALLFFSMTFFFFGSIIGFRGLRPKPRYGYGSKFMNLVAAGGETGRKTLNQAAAGFEVYNMIRANEASAAIDLIRNGIILFAIASAISFVAPSKPIELPAAIIPKIERI